MSTTYELIADNQAYATDFDKGDLPMQPSRKVAVLACMDARLDVYRLLGLELGEAHVIRNAGGVVTDDAVRFLIISQQLLGTREIVLIHHTDCGMLTFRDDDVKAEILRETGIRPSFLDNRGLGEVFQDWRRIGDHQTVRPAFHWSRLPQPPL